MDTRINNVGKMYLVTCITRTYIDGPSGVQGSMFYSKIIFIVCLILERLFIICKNMYKKNAFGF